MMPVPPRGGVRQPSSELAADLLVVVGRERTVLLSGFLAGVCVFFAPMLVLGVGLVAAYLAYVVSDGTSPAFGMGRPLTSADFRAVFAPAVNEVPLLSTLGLTGAALAQFRRWLMQRADKAMLLSGVRPFFPEFAFLYLSLVVLTPASVLMRGGWPQAQRLLDAAPVFLLFMLCATWLFHAVWQYSFRNVIDLLASAAERTAASDLRRRVGARRSRPTISPG